MYSLEQRFATTSFQVTAHSFTSPKSQVNHGRYVLEYSALHSSSAICTRLYFYFVKEGGLFNRINIIGRFFIIYSVFFARKRLRKQPLTCLQNVVSSQHFMCRICNSVPHTAVRVYLVSHF